VKVLIIGNGGREHALAWKLLQSPQIKQIFCAPGNGGTATLPGCQNIPLQVNDFEGIGRTAAVNGVSLIVVGPELPLSLGITDYLQKQNLMVFGPNRAAAQLEASKSWAKALMVEAGIPTAASATFTDKDEAKVYVRETGAPIVIKADGLAAGKGVIVANTLAEALEAIDSLFVNGFSKLVIEEYLLGEEVSILGLTDGNTVRTLLPAQDHKRIGEGDTGGNTGGMGAYCPAPIATPELIEWTRKEILQATVNALKKRGIDYKGVLYAGLMVNPQGKAKVLEFNCRFGDPETQAILPLLETPLDELMLACIRGQLAEHPPLVWKSEVSVCVIASAKGYPNAYEKGKIISGIEVAQNKGALVFQAGTKLKEKQLLSDGGRVLGVTALGSNYETAIAQAYQTLDDINFERMYYRRDIAHRVRS
jgi:phosphoribosylamine--glycine ligase